MPKPVLKRHSAGYFAALEDCLFNRQEWIKKNNPVRKLRHAINPVMTRTEFSAFLGYHPTTVGQWENGLRVPGRLLESGQKLRRTATTFGCDPADFDQWFEFAAEELSRLFPYPVKEEG